MVLVEMVILEMVQVGCCHVAMVTSHQRHQWWRLFGVAMVTLATGRS